MDEKEKQQALEEEQARLQALKVTDYFFLKQITSESLLSPSPPPSVFNVSGPDVIFILPALGSDLDMNISQTLLLTLVNEHMVLMIHSRFTPEEVLHMI